MRTNATAAPTTTNMNASVAYRRDGSYAAPGSWNAAATSAAATGMVTRSPARPDAQLPPDAVNGRARRLVHLDHLRPVAGEPFLGPFACRVDPHLRAVRECPARVIEDVDRAHREPRIALGVDVVERD